MIEKLTKIVVRLVGWKATALFSDPLAFDRLKWLQHNLKEGQLKTLDAGCGSGAFTIYAAKGGNQAVGISYDERSIRNARVFAQILGIRNIEFIQADLRELHLLSNRLGTFDQIICFEVIEHILDDKKLVRDLSNLLKPGGVILLTSPFNYEHPAGEIRSEVEDGRHVRWGYTHEELKEMFSEYGLDILVQDYVSGYISSKLGALTGIINKVNPILAHLIVFPFRVFQVFDRPVTKFLRGPFHCVAVVGVKRGINHTRLHGGRNG